MAQRCVHLCGIGDKILLRLWTVLVRSIEAVCDGTMALLKPVVEGAVDDVGLLDELLVAEIVPVDEYPVK
ncbi:hypothetical protein DPMN_017599 [Dreissena polymorpha]|uniref:Uncharacterized protein n=1 Tax=Dreissena polymorpha TaxID=45954 RepID=A0A9D4NBN9_DREPO|nr:hypothetical protein DPMN_017599 [Dreissena polymorpha]